MGDGEELYRAARRVAFLLVCYVEDDLGAAGRYLVSSIASMFRPTQDSLSIYYQFIMAFPKVTIIVTLLTAASKDDLGMLSDAKKFGDFSVALSSEDILPEYTIRTMKVRYVDDAIHPRRC